MSLVMSRSTIGVLAIQGDFAAHARALERVGVRAAEVRRAVDLENIDGLIIPGGESTTMLKLIAEDDLGRSITAFAREGKPVFGTCAGTILLAREVHNPRQESLGLIDIDVERNAYGRQVDSFIAEAETTLEGGPLEAVFIRAPKIRRVGTSIDVLARIELEPVFVRQGNVLAATFHPELAEDQRVHRLFAEMVARSKGRAAYPVV
jgi:5'-phosphate synthase pdxT subunit